MVSRRWRCIEGGPREDRSARLSGVSLRSVKRIAQEQPVVHVDDEAERSKRTRAIEELHLNFPEIMLAELPRKAFETNQRLGGD
jgi:hypothetical protein